MIKMIITDLPKTKRVHFMPEILSEISISRTHILGMNDSVLQGKNKSIKISSLRKVSYSKFFLIIWFQGNENLLTKFN